MAFSVSQLSHERYVRVRLAGELDLSTTPELNAAVDKVLDEGHRHILVDLGDLAFCDSSGLAALVRGDDLATERGGWLRLTGATGRVDRVLRISGLADLLRYDETVQNPAVAGDR